MNVSQASKIWLDYHRAHSKQNTVRAYEFSITKFSRNFANQTLSELSTDNIQNQQCTQSANAGTDGKGWDEGR
jgi:hypothetical protein